MPNPHDNESSRQKSYGGKEVIKNYVEKHQILRMVNTMADELLQTKPANPEEFLAGYFASMPRRGRAESNPGRATTTASLSPTATSSLASKALKSAVRTHSGETFKESKIRRRISETKISFEDQDLLSELAKLWERCSTEPSLDSKLQSFGSRLKKALPPAVAPHAWSFGNTNATSPSALIGSVSQRKIAAMPGESSNSQADLTIVNVGNTKFDATEDGKNANACKIEKVRFYEESYKPPLDVFQTRDGLRNWHAAGKKLWPTKAIDGLRKNCRTMTEHHTYGEPMEVVIPLFIYSVSIYCNVCWSMWIQTAVDSKGTSVRLGRWIEVKDYKYLEDKYTECRVNNSKLVIKISQDKGPWEKFRERVKAEVKCEARKAMLGDAESQALDLNITWNGDELESVFHDGKYVTDSSNTTIESWKGLTYFSEKSTQPPPPTETPEGSKVVVKLFLARYEQQVENDGNKKYPLSDSIAWLPHPAILRNPNGKCCQLKHVEWRKRSTCSVEADDRDTPRCYNKYFVGSPKDPIPLCDIPPPGMLEYLQSRRSREHLTYGGVLSIPLSKDHNCKQDSVFDKVKALVEECLAQKNQQQINTTINDKFDKIFEPNDNEKHSLKSKLWTTLIKPKLGKGFETDNENDELNAQPPTPLQIAHSLDIQRVEWTADNRKKVVLYASLSGSSFFIMTEDQQSTPLFRCCEEYEEQPYWHLNATMRALQNNTKPELKVKLNAINKTNFKDSKETYCTFELGSSSALGRSLGCLRAITHSPKLQNHLALLHKWSWACAFTSRDTRHQVKWYCDHREDQGEYLDPRSCTNVGWWAVKYGKEENDFESHFLPQGDCKLSLGSYMIDQVRPLLYYVQEAMKNMNAKVSDSEGTYDCAPKDKKIKGYRGMQGVKLNRKAYSRGNVVLWSSFSSTSLDQGISQSYAAGKDASVFIIEGYSCRLIAPWSRFGREEEWLFPMNSRFEVKGNAFG
eukprot:TRINITY_DN2179_c0_g1_i7.p1 TRINITY_DN2179_c0_g1~~TRINITY_DN2179_c0_g1_i7.p1  ORF type:complete len:970 (+),score=150.96 TRINITY_DN2179_c0_g1_i7:36-2945(+)